MPEPVTIRRYLHVMGDAPIMLVTEVPPEFVFPAWCASVRDKGYYTDELGVYIPYHSIRCIMMTSGKTPVPGYNSGGFTPDDSNITPFPPRPA